jgi:hypothetical protein
MSAPAERLLQDVQRAHAAERVHAGSAWHETGHVFTTETGEPATRAMLGLERQAADLKSRVSRP